MVNLLSSCQVTCLDFLSPRLLIAGTTNGVIILWDVEEQKIIQRSGSSPGQLSGGSGRKMNSAIDRIVNVLVSNIPIFGLFTWLDTIRFWFAEEYIRTKVTRHTNDEYELFTHVHTSKRVVTFVLRHAAAS